MHRIDTATSAQGLFTGGNPAYGVPPTQLSPEWFNDIQESLLRLLDEAGIVPSKGNYEQLLESLRNLIRPSAAQLMLRGCDFTGLNVVESTAGSAYSSTSNNTVVASRSLPLPAGSRLTSMTVITFRHIQQGSLVVKVEEATYSPTPSATIIGTVMEVNNSTVGMGYIIQSQPLNHLMSTDHPMRLIAEWTTGATVPNIELAAILVNYQPPEPSF